LKVILKRKWTIISFVFIVLIATGVMTFTRSPIYRSTATIQINKENPQVVDFKEIFSINTVEMDYHQTQYRILESRTLAKRVVHSLKLSEHPEFLPKPKTAIKSRKEDFGLLLWVPQFSQGRCRRGNEKGDPSVSQFLSRLKMSLSGTRSRENPFRFKH
jgi:uncharacterized protein involved in exopolysaccharide biosynthesis